MRDAATPNSLHAFFQVAQNRLGTTDAPGGAIRCAHQLGRWEAS